MIFKKQSNQILLPKILNQNVHKKGKMFKPETVLVEKNHCKVIEDLFHGITDVEYNYLKVLTLNNYVIQCSASLKMNLEFTGRHSSYLSCNNAVESQICKGTSQ